MNFKDGLRDSPDYTIFLDIKTLCTAYSPIQRSGKQCGVLERCGFENHVDLGFNSSDLAVVCQVEQSVYPAHFVFSTMAVSAFLEEL